MQHPIELAAKALESAYTECSLQNPTSSARSTLEYCDAQYGDFASSAALKLAKQYKKPPREIAEALCKALTHNKIIATAEVAGPGFINIRLQESVWVSYFNSIDHTFGSAVRADPGSVQIEFISANPTGPLVLTNAWAGYYGDILANIYASQGYDVSREYYLNDGGNQLVALGKAVHQAFGKVFDPEVTKELYRGKYIDQVALQLLKELGSKEVVLGMAEAQVGKRASEIILEQYIKPDLALLGVHFDTIFSETIPDTKATLSRLDEKGLLKRKAGAIWLEGDKVGLSQDEVLVRSYDQGETYFLKDIAYQLNRLEERKFDQTLTIWGPDHHGQAIRLQKTLEALGHTTFGQLYTQTIRLIKDGTEFKMSKRKGNYILLDDFLHEVPSEVARFYFAMRDTNSHMDFDLDLVKEHSNKNPVYYALYGYARACAIQEKAYGEGLTPASALDEKLLSATQLQLIRQISEIPLLLRVIPENHKVHLLLHKVLDVATSFHNWYENEKVIGAEDAQHKLYLVEQFKVCYEAVFKLIGVTLQERM